MSLPKGRFLNSELAQLEEEEHQTEQGEADITQAYIQALEETIQAQALEIKFGHVGSPGSLFQICVDEFAQRANFRLGEKAKVVGYGSSQLGKDRELLRKLKLVQIS